jgi:hypothetical protein
MSTTTRVRSAIAGLALFLFLPLVANAYTLVLRDGRRVEIPNKFEVEASTLTYEAAPGIQITFQLATLDVAATERANNEKSGSLLARSTQTRVEPVSKVTPRATPTRRVVTNEDLDRYRKAREASENAYEQRRKELGLPSVEESRRIAMEITERTHEQLASIRTREQESEAYWRQRASELRSELAATNARINFVQGRMNELPLNYAFGAFTTTSPFLSVNQLARGASFPAFANGGTFGPRFGARAVEVNRRPGQINRFNRPGFARRPFGNQFPFGPLVALPFDAYDNSYERSALLSELDQLLAQRAGLQARWRDLEDEARRSGAYPGWLR